ncbi:MAG: hypothetical protein WC076_13385 [Terrimicrobiaceae bacterium]|nr:hypothetical protein [Terrimicrobiaceae bacterium]
MSFWFFAAVCAVSAFGQTGGKVTMKSGAVMEYQEARVEGGEIVMKLPHGMMRLPVSLVSEESLRRVGEAPGTSAARPAPAGSPANAPAPAKAQASPSPAPGAAAGLAPVGPGVQAGAASPSLPDKTGAKQPEPGNPEPVISADPLPPETGGAGKAVFVPTAFPSAGHLPASLPSRPVSAKKYDTKEWGFELPSKLEGNKKVIFQVLVPAGKDGGPAEGAEDIVFYAPFLNARSILKGSPFRELAEMHGMTVFSCDITTDPALVDDPAKCYYFAGSGFFQTVLEAWEKVRQKVGGASKNLLLAGNSGGASMAERFALAYPGKVDGAVLVSGWHYEPMAGPNAVAWCLVHTRGDRREDANRELVEQGRALGLNMLCAITPPVAGDKKGFERHEVEDFHHSADEAGFAIANQFLVAIRDLRLKGALAKPETWPFAAKLPEGCAIEQNTGGGEGAGPRLLFPSGDFAAAWQSNGNRFCAVKTPRGREIEVLVRYPRGLPPKGIVLFGGGSTAFPAYQGDDMDFLAMQGFIVVGAPSAEDVGVDEWEAVANWIASGPQWGSLPISLVGFEDAGRDFLVLAPRLKSERFRAVAAVDAPLLLPRDELSPLQALPLTRQKVLLASLDPAPEKREPFLGYMKAAKGAGPQAEIVPTPAESPSLRFDLLEGLSQKLK